MSTITIYVGKLEPIEFLKAVPVQKNIKLFPSRYFFLGVRLVT